MIRTRFAPSPTGPLHIGGLRTALFNYLAAKKYGGEFILRIEDTDSSRYVPDSVDYILESLKWVGIKPDKGILADGKIDPEYCQSERAKSGIYLKYAEDLVKSGHAYYAFDSVLDLMAEKDKDPKFTYNATSRERMKNSLTLPANEVKTLLEIRNDWVIRFKMPDEPEIITTFDTIRGVINTSTDTLDDKVLWKKSDSLPTYHLASVVDDHLMEITHVIRGEEWLPSLPLHYMLYLALSWVPPGYTHLADILKPIGCGPGKLSKRDGDKLGFPVFPIEWKSKSISVSGYRETGFFPDALINLLMFYGWRPAEIKGEKAQEIYSLNELINVFDLARCTKTGAHFDYTKAKWFNKEYLKIKSDREILEELDLETALGARTEYYQKILDLVKPRLTFPLDILEQGSVFFHDPDGIRLKDFEENEENIPEALELAKDLIKTDSPSENFEPTIIKRYGGWKEAIKTINCLRMIISGSSKGLDMKATLGILGKETLINRIELFKKNYGY